MLNFKTKRKLMSVAVASALGMIVLPGMAQEAAQGTKAVEDNGQIQEVKVTALRRSTSLLKTPVAVSAVTQETLTREGITDVRGLSGTVPNLQISTGGDSGVQIAMRGVSSSDFTETGDPAVGLHIAGLYSPRPQGAMALMFDLEQVEVLRGPQGTLFGRNSTGGSINIIPAKPEFGSTYGNAEIDLGNYNKRQINVVENVGVSEGLALRGTFMKVTRDGWVHQTQDLNPLVDQRYNYKVSAKDFYNNKNEWAGRLAARLKLSNDLDWQVTYERFQNSGAGDAFLKDCDQAAGTPYACASKHPGDISVNLPGKIDMTIDTIRSALSWNLSKSTTIDYGFAYADQRRFQQHDDDAGYHTLASEVADIGVPVIDNSSITLQSKYKSMVHDVQLKQNFDTWHYVAGVFWMHEKNKIDYGMQQLVNPAGDYPAAELFSQPDRQIDSKAVYAQLDWEFAPTWTATFGARYSHDTKTDKGGKVWNGGFDPSVADYYNGLAGSNPTPSVSLLTKQMGAFAGAGAYAAYAADGFFEHNDHSESWKKPTYRLGLMNQVTPNDMVYTSLSTGYKAGGFGDRQDKCGSHVCTDGSTDQFSFFPYKPETVTNLEFGYKGKFLEKRMNLSTTLFYSRYKDKQDTNTYFSANIQPYPGCVGEGCKTVQAYQTINVGSVDIPGIEVEMDYKPWKGARFGGMFSYINTKVKSYPTFSDGWQCNYREAYGAPACPPAYTGTDPQLVGLNPYNIKGNHLPLAPKYNIGANFSQDVALDGGYTVTPWVAMKWQDKMYFTLRNLDNPHISDAQKAYAKLDASIKLQSPDKKWHVEVYGLNLTNVYSKNSAQSPEAADNSSAAGFIRGSYDDPRMYGVRFGMEY